MPRRTTKSQPAITVPTVTDEQYKELLSIRLAAMHGFADGTVDEATKNQARTAVRKARKVRHLEEENGVLPDYREYQAKQVAEAEAKKATRTRKPRVKKVAETDTRSETESTPAETGADSVPETESTPAEPLS